MTAIIHPFPYTQTRFLPEPPVDAQTLIADFGHPHWPGWRAVIALLVALQVWALFQLNTPPLIRPVRLTGGVARLVRGATRNTSRSGSRIPSRTSRKLSSTSIN